MTIVWDMMDALIAAGYATEFGVDIFYHYFQPEPTAQLMVMQKRGLNPIVTTDDVTPMPGLQVYVIDSDLEAAETKAEAIYNYFRLSKGVVGQAIYASGVPVFLGPIGDGRYKFVVDFQVFGN